MTQTKAQQRRQKLDAALAEVVSGADKHDDESAHSDEDHMREMVLTWIASGEVRGAEAREMAARALSTNALDFARWCA